MSQALVVLPGFARRSTKVLLPSILAGAVLATGQAAPAPAATLPAAPAAVTSAALPQAYVAPHAGSYRTLRWGSRGRAVKKVQRKLHVRPVSGFYGPKTTAAVKRFQRRHDIRVTGVVNARTARALRLGKVARSSVRPARVGYVYGLGRVRPHVAKAAYLVGPRFGIRRVGGYRANAADRNGHPAGRALDFMTRGRTGDRLAGYMKRNAREYRVEYIIWDRRIWSVGRSREGWRPYRGASPHTDHVHVNFKR